MGVMVSNEGKACDAIVRFIEQRTGEVRGDVRRPENDQVGPPVDFRMKIGTVEYAIEHTVVEAFEGQISTGVALEFFASVKNALCGKLPGSGAYSVHFPTDPRFGESKEKLKCLQESLIKWIRKTAHTLQERESGKRLPPISGRPHGFPYEIGLSYHVIIPGRRPGSLDLVRSSPISLEQRSSRELQRALRKKLPKLHSCKCEGARTVLVLENDDSPLRDANLVGMALVELRENLSSHLSFPDEIYFVKTRSEPWWVWTMKHDDRWWTGEDLRSYKKFDVDKLINLCRCTAANSR